MAPDNTRQTRVHYGQHFEEVRKRAYELYETRGREDGHDMEDWLRAEQEVTSRETRKAAA